MPDIQLITSCFSDGTYLSLIFVFMISKLFFREAEEEEDEEEDEEDQQDDGQETSTKEESKIES